MGVGFQDAFGNASVLHELQKRKQVEQDAGRLRNRLLQLERQTEKADKRITQTKQRARDVLGQRERNEKRERDRQRYIDDLHQEIQQHREDITKVKDESRRNRLENEARLFHQKLCLVQETRLEKREIERILADQRLLDRRAALEKKDEARSMQHHVRRALDNGGKALAAEEERKRALARQTHAERVQAEVDARLEAEAELRKMSQIELDLIDQLKERQEEQRQAYEQLQAAINLGKPTPWRTPEPAPPEEPETSAHAPESPSFSEEATRSAFTLVAQACSDDADWIEVGQLGDVLSALGVHLSAEQLGESATQLDPEHSGRIAVNEFVSWIQG